MAKVQPDVNIQEEKLGFEYEGTWIVDPTVSECSRFIVKDPCDYYGISKKQLKQIIEYNKIGECEWLES